MNRKLNTFFFYFYFFCSDFNFSFYTQSQKQIVKSLAVFYYVFLHSDKLAEQFKCFNLEQK